jgi:hypothetical protein
MIEEKYIKFKDEKYYFQYGKTSVNEVLQHNVTKKYTEQFEMLDGNLSFKFLQYKFSIPNEAAEQMYKTAEIKINPYVKVLTAREGDVRYRLLLDFNGV